MNLGSVRELTRLSLGLPCLFNGFWPIGSGSYSTPGFFWRHLPVLARSERLWNHRRYLATIISKCVNDGLRMFAQIERLTLPPPSIASQISISSHWSQLRGRASSCLLMVSDGLLSPLVHLIDAFRSPHHVCRLRCNLKGIYPF